jgi:hypothetical protein
VTGQELIEPAGEWVGISEAARRLSVTERTVERHLQHGKLRKRTRENGRVEVWVSVGAETGQRDGGRDSDGALVPREDLLAAIREAVTARDETIVGIVSGHEALIRENERLRARVAELERMLPAPTATDTPTAVPTRPTGWRRWWVWLASP